MADDRACVRQRWTRSHPRNYVIPGVTLRCKRCLLFQHGLRIDTNDIAIVIGNAHIAYEDANLLAIALLTHHNIIIYELLRCTHTDWMSV